MKRAFLGGIKEAAVPEGITGNARLLARKEAVELADFSVQPPGAKMPEEFLDALRGGTAARFFYVEPGGNARIEAEGGGDAFFIFGKGSKSSVFFKAEHRKSQATCAGLRLHSGAKAQFGFVKKSDAQTTAKSCVVARLGESASLDFFESGFGEGNDEGRLLFLQEGRGSRCGHYDASLAAFGQEMHKESEHFHLAQDTYSRSVFKYATLGKSKVEVEGKVTIGKDAPGSDAHLLARGLLLSPNSRCKVTPQLFVHNSDVSAGHGSAMSPPDEGELFYLQSRGLDDMECRLLLLDGFLQDVMQRGKAGRHIALRFAKELSAAARAAVLGDGHAGC